MMMMMKLIPVWDRHEWKWIPEVGREKDGNLSQMGAEREGRKEGEAKLLKGSNTMRRQEGQGGCLHSLQGAHTLRSITILAIVSHSHFPTHGPL